MAAIVLGWLWHPMGLGFPAECQAATRGRFRALGSWRLLVPEGHDGAPCCCITGAMSQKMLRLKCFLLCLFFTKIIFCFIFLPLDLVGLWMHTELPPAFLVSCPELLPGKRPKQRHPKAKALYISAFPKINLCAVFVAVSFSFYSHSGSLTDSRPSIP